MSARKNLDGILEQWLELTRAESRAIEISAWVTLKQIQARKAALRPALAQAARLCAEEDAAHGPDQPALQQFRAKVGGIISLLTRNGQALAAQLRQARARQELINQAKLNLQKIQRSYALPRQPRSWQLYS